MTGDDGMPRTVTCAVVGDRVLAPAVGWWLDPPAEGALVDALGDVGRLERFGTRERLVLPEGTAGRVASPANGGRRRVAIEHGQVLFRLDAVADLGAAAAAADADTAGDLVFRSPSDGVYYGRPAPGRAPFVEPGAIVERGAAVGLLEVMKTFSQIAYAGKGLPDRARVVAVLVEDGDEVARGQPLLELEPA